MAAGSYTLTATAHSEKDGSGSGSELGTLSVEFMVAGWPLTARFEGLPEAGHGGAGAPFTFRLVFSDAVTTTPEALRDHALEATNATVEAVSRVDHRSDLWEVRLTPETDAMVTVSLSPAADCNAAGAVCTEDGRMLSVGTARVILGPPPNSPAIGQPTISGTLQVGETLTASTAGIADADGLDTATFSYQWLAGDVAIQDATGSGYTLTQAEQGQTVKVRVSFTDDAGHQETRTSDPTGAVAAAPNSQATGAPTITGTARVGETLAADVSAIVDADGLDTATFSYQWRADDVDIAGANGSGYTLTSAEQGKAITVTASFTDAAGNPETLTSDPTGEVEAKPNTQATGLPTISGTVQVGQTLTADTSGIDDEDGLNQVVFSYQWIRNDGNADEDIAGATGSSYTLAEDDEGKTIKVTVSFTDNAGNQESLTSEPTEAVAAVNQLATGQPVIVGIVRVGQTLTADTSGIADEDGLDTATFSYQWLADDLAIAGAGGSGYTLTQAEQGKTVKVRVSFTDDAGHQESLTSDPTGAVEPPANSRSTGAPTIAGTVQVGETLTADTSGIADEDGLDNVVFSYQWIQNDGSDDTEIAGASGSSYTLTKAEQGQTILVKVSFTDDANHEESLTSAATDAVTALPVPGKPQDLEGEATAQGIALTWSAPSGSAVTQYVVYRAELENGQLHGRPMKKYATIDATGADMAYTDDNVEAGVEYRYRVAAVNSAGEGKKSNWLDIAAEEPAP